MTKTGLAFSLLLISIGGSVIASSSENLEDPTRPLINTKAKLTKSNEQARKKTDSKPKNVLMGIVRTAQGKLAIIDGERLKVGSHINGYKIHAINYNSVVLTQSGKTKTLELAPSIKSQGN